MKYLLPLLFFFVLFTGYCRTPREKITKIGVAEGWVDDTRFVVVTIGAQAYNNEAAKVAADGACAVAESQIPVRFSQLMVGGDAAKRCDGVDPANDSYCDWNYRLDPSVFKFRGVDIKRRHDFSSLGAVCEIAHEYRHPDLKNKTIEYAAIFNVTPAAP
ncbi:MAG: hypothetical protein J0L53_04085 [Spirochaetes bacterium]|nr:hypothetical protein [Spirochaetota bacterium]MBX3720954.1 hypothetical protein [Turneriella sp.]